MKYIENIIKQVVNKTVREIEETKERKKREDINDQKRYRYSLQTKHDIVYNNPYLRNMYDEGYIQTNNKLSVVVDNGLVQIIDTNNVVLYTMKKDLFGCLTLMYDKEQMEGNDE